MSRSSRILVLGSRGMLGTHVLAAFRESPSSGIVLQNHPRFSREAELARFLTEQTATTVINCLGYTGEDPVEHFKVNAGFPRVIANVCSGADALFVQVSTNAVFPADDWRFWLPADPTDPETLYETSKALGEDPRAYVIRSSFIGHHPKGSGLFDVLQKGRPYSGRKWNGVTALTLAQHIVRLVERFDGETTPAVDHLHSPRVTTVDEIAQALRSKSQPHGTPRPAKLLGGGQPLPDLAEQLQEYVRWLASPALKEFAI